MVLAKFAGASFVERDKVIAVFGVFDVDAAVFSVEGAVAGEASGADAVEGVAAVEDAEEEVARFAAHAEKMAGFFGGEDFVGEFDDFSGFGSFGSVETADAKAVDGLVFHEFGGDGAEVREEAALDDGVERLDGLFVAFGLVFEELVSFEIFEEPSMGAEHGLFHD